MGKNHSGSWKSTHLSVSIVPESKCSGGQPYPFKGSLAEDSLFFSSALDLLGGFGAKFSRCGSHNYISIEPNRITKGRTLSRRITLISVDFMHITDNFQTTTHLHPS